MGCVKEGASASLPGPLQQLPKAGAARTFIALAAITLIALGLRVWNLKSESPWWDEVASLKYLDAPTLTAFLQNERATDPPMTPVYFTTEYYWSRLVGTSVLGMRLLSVLLGLLTIQMLFMLTRRLYGDTAGLISSLFLALSLLHIYYSQEIRVYALVLLLSLISMYAFIGILEGGRAGWWAMHLAANLLVVFTHFFAILLIATQACFLLVCRRREKRLTAVWIACHSVIGLFLGAWVLTINTAMLSQAASWMVKPGLREIGMFWLVFAGGRASNENPAAHLPSGVSLDVVLAGLLLFLILWYSATLLVRETEREAQAKTSSINRKKAYSVLMVMWLVIPPAALCIASYVFRPCFVYRYVLFSSLPVYALAGASTAVIRSARARGVLVAVVAILYAHQLSALASGPFRPDWQSVSRYLETKASPNDSILVFQDINLIALEFNSDLPRNQMKNISVWSELCGPAMAAHTAGRDVWFVVWMWSDPRKLEACFISNNLEFGHKDFDGWPNLRVYHVPAQRQTAGVS
jgi:uncharacterized membrane protein